MCISWSIFVLPPTSDFHGDASPLSASRHLSPVHRFRMVTQVWLPVHLARPYLWSTQVGTPSPGLNLNTLIPLAQLVRKDSRLWWNLEILPMAFEPEIPQHPLVLLPLCLRCLVPSAWYSHSVVVGSYTTDTSESQVRIPWIQSPDFIIDCDQYGRIRHSWIDPYQSFFIFTLSSRNFGKTPTCDNDKHIWMSHVTYKWIMTESR